VVVISLPRPAEAGWEAPPVELLEADAAEFARCPQMLAPINRSEME
jgi:hypothetical protein